MTSRSEISKQFRAVVVLIIVIFTQASCSVYKAATQPGPANLEGIGVGTSRHQLFARLGPPKFTDADAQGHKQDTFEFYSGLNEASKARIVLYLAADVFTLTLAELILWPLEMTAMEKASCIGLATYDSNLKVEAWGVHKKGSESGSQEC